VAAKRQRLAELRAEEAVRAQRAQAAEAHRARRAKKDAATAAIAAEMEARELERLKLKAELKAVMTQAGRVLQQCDWDAMGPEWSTKVARYKQLRLSGRDGTTSCLGMSGGTG